DQGTPVPLRRAFGDHVVQTAFERGWSHLENGAMAQLIALTSSTLAWPILQLAVFWLRFQRLPPSGPSGALVFVPMGLLAGVVLAALLTIARSVDQRRLVVYGYFVASPVAFVGSLLGGLGLPGPWGPLLFGAVPLAIGCALGFFVGREPQRNGLTGA
ncbi:MAG: hypothetical protein ACREL5_14280, partial [Gemmatimonadales bacterium]